MKSTTKESFGTGRDVSVEMITKWRERHWVFAHGTNYDNGFSIEEMYYCSPAMMKEKFDEMELRFAPDIHIRDTIMIHVKRILNSAQLKRLYYLVSRGMTYNNPHIGLKYVKEHGVKINLEFPAEHLKKIMRDSGV